MVVIGAGRTFVAGADIKGLEEIAWGGDSGAPDMHDLLQRIEDLPKPVVMAMHGTALGGGLELAMAGHYRVAVADGQMGQPEVNLGIIPGAEGTQRLPRLVGVEKAIEMCVSGKPIKAKDALAAGLIDRDRRRRSRDRGGRLRARDGVAAAPHPKTRERTDKLPPPRGRRRRCSPRARSWRARRGGNMEAPVEVVDALEAAATLPFAEGCVREREIFFECVASEQAKALIHAFFAERGVSKVPGVSKDTPAAAGRDGRHRRRRDDGRRHRHGVRERRHAGATDRCDAGRARPGLATIRKNYDVSVKRGRFTPESVEQRLASIRPQVGYDGFGDADLVIEAVFENLALKKEIVAALDAVAKPGCILATNTSTLDIDAIAAATSRPDKVVGLHFFSPANVMRLVEIVRGTATSPATLATAMAAGQAPRQSRRRRRQLRRVRRQSHDVPLHVRGAVPGRGRRDAGAGGPGADRLRHGDGHLRRGRHGRPRRRLARAAGAQAVQQAGDRKPLVADTLCEMGRFGQKTGKGWYVYGDDRKPTPDPEVLALIERAASGGRHSPPADHDDEIIERTIYALINEGARVLDEGFASRAADIDVVYLTGYGFPAWRGGPMFYADRVGLAKVYERVSAFHRELGAALGAGAAARAPGDGRLDLQGASTRAAPPNWPERPREHDGARANARPVRDRPVRRRRAPRCGRHGLHAVRARRSARIRTR